MSAAMLREELESAVSALTAFDVDRLEATERRLHHLTAASLTNAALPELQSQHAVLGQLLAATAQNLKLLASVLSTEGRDLHGLRRSPWGL